MKKKTCYECKHKQSCNTLDKCRGMICKDFEKNENNTKQEGGK